MNVILCEDVENVGKMGARVNVSAGYARNYLLPRKLAVRADSATAKQIEHEMHIIRRREEKRRASLTKVAEKMRAVTLEFKVRAGAEDKIFGSVTAAMIAEKLVELGYDVSRKQVSLDDPIKALGIFVVSIKLLSGIEAPVKVWVTGLDDEVTTETASLEAEGQDTSVGEA